MLQSNFDVSVSLAGDMTYPDDMKFSSLTRSGRPVIIASNPHRDGELRQPPLTLGVWQGVLFTYIDIILKLGCTLYFVLLFHGYNLYQR